MASTIEMPDAVSDRERMRFEEWKYRHDLFHKLMFRYTAAVAALGAVPILQASTICVYHVSTFLLAMITFFISIMGIWHMIFEFSRLVELRMAITQSTPTTLAQLRERAPFYHWVKKLPFNVFMWGTLVAFMGLVSLSILFFPAITCPKP